MTKKRLSRKLKRSGYDFQILEVVGGVRSTPTASPVPSIKTKQEPNNFMPDTKKEPPIVVVILDDLKKNNSYSEDYLKKRAEEIGDRIIRCGGQS